MKEEEFKTQSQNSKYLLAIHIGDQAKFNKQRLRSTLFSLKKKKRDNISWMLKVIPSIDSPLKGRQIMHIALLKNRKWNTA